MLRKKYQDKFFGLDLEENNNLEIKDIEHEFSLVSELFTELNKEVFYSQKNIELIEDYIITSNEELQNEVENDIEESNKSYFISLKNNIRMSLFGAGFGSLVAIYNPYIAIASILSGGIAGWVISDKLISK